MNIHVVFQSIKLIKGEQKYTIIVGFL